MGNNQRQTSTSYGVKEKLRIKEPDLFDVFMLNDDFTTMDFVVRILEDVFYLDSGSAEAIMLRIHHEGKAVVGTFTYDMAKSKILTCEEIAREEKFPLRLTMELHED